MVLSGDCLALNGDCLALSGDCRDWPSADADGEDRIRLAGSRASSLASLWSSGGELGHWLLMAVLLLLLLLLVVTNQGRGVCSPSQGTWMPLVGELMMDGDWRFSKAVNMGRVTGTGERV